MTKLYQCLMCGFSNAYEETWRHVAQAHINMYYSPWLCSSGRAFKSLEDVNRHMKRTGFKRVFIPEVSILEQAVVAFKKMICRLPRGSAPRPTTQTQSQHSVEPISDDELDYEDTCFTPDSELRLGLIPCQISANRRKNILSS